MKKLIFLILISLALLLTLIPAAQATPVPVYIYSSSDSAPDGDFTIAESNWLNGTAVRGYALCFRAAYTSYVENISLMVKYVGSPVGELFISVNNMTGTIETNAIPTSELARTAYFAANSLPAAYAWKNFSLTSNLLLTAGGYYSIILETRDVGYDIGIDSGNNVCWGYTTVAYTNGSSCHWALPNGMHYLDPNDAMAIVYGDLAYVPETTPAPLPTEGSYDTSDTDAVINTLSGYLLPLLTFLVPALIMGYLTHWSKWPIMIGLAIGSGLTYLFLGTAYIWLVFLVVVGLIGMAYQSVSGGGGRT